MKFVLKFKIKNIFRHEEEHRRREEEMIRHREQEELRRQQEGGFKPNYMENVSEIPASQDDSIYCMMYTYISLDFLFLIVYFLLSEFFRVVKLVVLLMSCK